MATKFTELFNEKQNELTPEQFKLWLCGAYGVFDAHISIGNTKPDDVLKSLKTCIVI